MGDSKFLKFKMGEEIHECVYDAKKFNISCSDNERETISIKKCGNFYTTEPPKGSTYVIDFTYKDKEIKTYNIHVLYVIMQYIYDVDTIIELSKLDWDWNQWNVKISPYNKSKKLSANMRAIQHILNLGDFGKMWKVETLNKECPLDQRGWGGERCREVYSGLGFPIFTSATCKQVKNTFRLVKSPFPTERINPKRIAIVKPGDDRLCFTCGVKEGESDRFGKPARFERGHFEPHVLGGSDLSRPQCKWCNTFYKDKITWNPETHKPQFNVKAVMRDAKHSVVREVNEELGFYTRDSPAQTLGIFMIAQMLWAPPSHHGACS